MNDSSTRQKFSKIAGFSIAIIILIFLLIMAWRDRTPSNFDPVANASQIATVKQHNLVTGYTSTATLITLTNSLLDKSDGYLSNDFTPP